MNQLRIADFGLRIVSVGVVARDLARQIRNPQSTIRNDWFHAA